MGRTRQRKKLFVDPAVQGAIVQRLMLHWVSVMAALFICLFIGQILSSNVEGSLNIHLAAMWQKYGVLLLVMLCLFPAFAYDSVKLSNRFAGPIYSLRQTLRKLAQGEDVPHLSFRKGDFWTEIAGDVNRVAQRLRESGDSRETEPWETTAASYVPSEQ